ncbi:MAG: glycosyltransferase family 2 protein [Candidatus Anstonellales archaeon]
MFCIKKTVSIILPTKNESETLEQILLSILFEFSNSNYTPQIIIADDNSTDGTKEIMEKFATRYPNKIIPLHRSPPYGFGLSVAEAINKASGFATIIMMADFSDRPSDAIKMAEKIEEGFDIVFSTRFSKGGKAHKYPLLKYLANRSFNNVLRILFLIPYSDTSNAFKAYKTELIKSLTPTSKGFEITIELPLLAIMNGAKACEIPVFWSNRDRGVPKWNILNAFIRYSTKLTELFFLRFVSSKTKISRS